MRPTADPGRLRQHAQTCRDQAARLDGAIATLNGVVSRTVGQTWTGTAAESFAQVINDQLQSTRTAADWLRSAAREFDRGADEVQAYRLAEERREREAQRRAQGGR